MAFDLYFASSGNQEMEDLLTGKQCHRLFTQLEKSSITRYRNMKAEDSRSQLFIDSGAFTAWTKSVTLDVDAYIDYINSFDSEIYICAQLDTIPGVCGKPRTYEERKSAPEKSWENYLYMKDKIVSRDKLLPIFHQEEDWKWLHNMLEYRHEDGSPIKYIGVSPANDSSQAEKEEFISKSFDIIRHSSNPNVKTHAFGMTNLSILERYPYTSADSTSWKLTAAYGSIFTPRGVVLVSSQQTNSKQHLMNMPKPAIDYVREKCVKYGVNFDLLGTDFGTRAIFNIEYLCEWAENYKCVYRPRLKKGLF